MNLPSPSSTFACPPLSRAAGLLMFAVLVTFGITLSAAGQEAPPSQERGPLVTLSVSEQVVPVGEEFVVEAMVEDVEHLASFGFTIEFEPGQMRFLRAEETETFLGSGERQAVTCEEPAVSEGAVVVSCVALAPPLCAGGPAGASGNGLLGRFVFQADAPSVAELALTESRLILDDVEPCEDAEELVDEIPHDTVDASVLLAAPSHEVQETPAVVRLQAPDERVEVGDEFEVQVAVDNVEHLGSFDFAVAYDPERASFVAIREAGAMLTADAQRDIVCVDPIDERSTILISCVARDAPACVGGVGGPSGSGVLGSVVFRAESAGTMTLALTNPTDLLLDDVQPCHPVDGFAITIPHERQGADVEIAGSDSFPWTVVGVIGAVVAVAIAGGALAMRRRTRPPASE